ncbi:MAG: zinc-binding alcohol dehydrogenase family protein [Alicyclobacillus mali]|uniref:zinc-binding alcohol dehydrogenase family protein n=1 Tax=Alicyclobacillus mali (ex Roth et al. 2021) TaxID=1123961 RepID=UPI0009EC7D2B|nr:zinc-binding alcohol dehydrogenase family protein [Alicyclobacillus mali (ex Roth et al. 2021)]MCL6489455.1 zinc-binding alcohol dehydrogenase family protein [Alicyclobacillus mali (ex Roth et al. 2021)]
MLKVQCERPFQFRVLNCEPISRGRGEVLVRVKRVGVCGTDFHAYRGEQPLVTYPRILGHEVAGVVEDVDSGASSLSTGEVVCLFPYRSCGKCKACLRGKPNCCRALDVIGVTSDGGMSDLISVPEDQLVSCNGLDLDQVVIVEPLSIAAHAVRRASVSSGDHVLVIGAGPIGIAVARLAAFRGAHVYITDLRRDRLEAAAQWGGSDQINVIPSDTSLQVVRELTAGNMMEIVFDATGNKQSMESALQYVGHGGCLALVGIAQGSLCYPHPEIHKRELTLLSCRNALRDDFHYVIELMRNKKIVVDGYITHRAMLVDIKHVWTEWELSMQNAVKCVFEV